MSNRDEVYNLIVERDQALTEAAGDVNWALVGVLGGGALIGGLTASIIALVKAAKEKKLRDVDFVKIVSKKIDKIKFCKYNKEEVVKSIEFFKSIDKYYTPVNDALKKFRDFLDSDRRPVTQYKDHFNKMAELIDEYSKAVDKYEVNIDNAISKYKKSSEDYEMIDTDVEWFKSKIKNLINEFPQAVRYIHYFTSDNDVWFTLNASIGRIAGTASGNEKAQNVISTISSTVETLENSYMSKANSISKKLREEAIYAIKQCGPKAKIQTKGKEPKE